MNLKKKLQNPFALIAQGFIGGAAIFYATMPANIDAQSQPVSPQSVQSEASSVSARI
jgi:hypothetical protein